MLGAVLCYTLHVTLGWGAPISVGLTLLLCAFWGLVVERCAVRPFVRRGSTAWLMSTVALGLVLENAALFTFGKEPRSLYLIAMVGLTTMVGVGLNILLGLSGQVSLGQVGFYAIGAYTAAVLTTKAGASFWLALGAASGLAGLIGTLVAMPALRVTGPYLAMVTIAFGFIVEHGTVEWRALTGGANGLMSIPAPAAWGYLFSERAVALLIISLTAMIVGLFWQFSTSPWGYALRAIRDAEIAAQSLGLRPVVLRTTAFTLSAVVAGLAGALFAVLTGFISPSTFPSCNLSCSCSSSLLAGLEQSVARGWVRLWSSSSPNVCLTWRNTAYSSLAGCSWSCS
jgi:ABC-type branched-subunit amino acid transport system permease subunit